jgi:hypothetical protein
MTLTIFKFDDQRKLGLSSSIDLKITQISYLPLLDYQSYLFIIEKPPIFWTSDSRKPYQEYSQSLQPKKLSKKKKKKKIN